MYKIIKNNDATFSIDLIVALVLVITTVITAILIMPALSHDNISQEDKSDRMMRYMLATRASDSLVQSAGEQGWETKWAEGNYSNVTKIGLVYVDADGKDILKVLDKTKVEALMGRGYVDNDGTELRWWEFPNSSVPYTSQAEKENVTMALGLKGYNLYMQLHPVGLDDFSSIPLMMNLTNQSINDHAVSVVDRFVYIKDDSCMGGFLCNENTTVHYRLNLWVW